MDSQNSERRKSTNCLKGVSSFKDELSLLKEPDSEGSLMDHQSAEGGEGSTCLISEQDVVTVIKEEEDEYSLDHQDSQRRESPNSPTGGPFLKTDLSLMKEQESEASLMYHQSADGGDGSTCLNLEQYGISIIIKEEEDDSLDPEYSERRESSNSPTEDRPETGSIKNKEQYTCSQCKKSFTRKAYLQVHKRIHTRERPFPCTVCGKRFTQEGYLLIHKRIHTGEKPFSCTECEKIFTQKGNLLSHQRTHTGERPFTCTKCDKSFTQKGQLLSHQRTHTEERPFPCTECEKSFKSKTHLLSHQRSHTGDQPFPCTECEKSFKHKHSLLRHERSHTGERPFSCTQCEKSFTQKGNLLIHQRIHTRE